MFLFHLRDLLDANPNPKHSFIIRFSTESLKERGKLQSQNECRPEIMPSTATLGSCGLLSSVSRACTGGDGSHTMPGLTFFQRCRVQHRETKSQPRKTISCGFTGMPLPSSSWKGMSGSTNLVPNPRIALRAFGQSLAPKLVHPIVISE